MPSREPSSPIRKAVSLPYSGWISARWSRFVNDFDLVLDGNRREGTKLIIPTGGGGEQLPWLQYLEDRPYLPRGRMNHRWP